LTAGDPGCRHRGRVGGNQVEDAGGKHHLGARNELTLLDC